MCVATLWICTNASEDERFAKLCAMQIRQRLEFFRSVSKGALTAFLAPAQDLKLAHLGLAELPEAVVGARGDSGHDGADLSVVSK